jgi:predicted RNA-binding Zn ribbon-like protein
MRSHPHVFRPADLVGGHVVLDLVNTVIARSADPIDWLDSYPRVLEWAALTEQFDAGVLAELERLDRSDPRAGKLALRRLRELRETIHDVLKATIRNQTPSEEKLALLEELWKNAVAHARVTVSDRRARLELGVASSGLDYVNHALALRAFDLLRTLPLDRTRICAGTKCGWIFVDRSRGGRRRWCDMATCGNAAKSRRHYERRRAERARNRRRDPGTVYRSPPTS